MFALSRGRRHQALINYALVLGREPDDPDVARVARRAFENYCRMLADFVLLGAMDADEVRQNGSYEGLEHIDAALAAGRGAIMAVPHMGSWDMAGSLGGALGYPVHAVAERFPGSLDEVVVTTRERLGLRVIPLGRAAVRQLLAALRQNHVVALLCDLPHGPGLEVQFFGRRATVPSGPASLALKTGARLLPSCVWRTGPAQYRIRIDPPLDLGEDDARGLMQRVIRHFEGFIREHPDQWYAFRPLFQA
jgi:KDO2-lipid IV(A) lauroyltransferase